jgi:hypothetical protein
MKLASALSSRIAEANKKVVVELQTLFRVLTVKKSE